MDNNFHQEQTGYQDSYQNQNQNEYRQPDWHDSYQDNHGSPNQQPGIGFGIASMVLGILALCFFCACLNIPLGILSIIFAILHITRHTGKNGFAIAGIITSVVSFVLTAVLIFGLSHWQNVAVPYEQGIVPFFFDDDDSYDNYDDWGDDDYIVNPDEHGSDKNFDSEHIDEDHAL